MGRKFLMLLSQGPRMVSVLPLLRFDFHFAITHKGGMCSTQGPALDEL